MNSVRQYLKHYWGISILVFILLWISIVNVRPGYFILGNDNYSPELHPQLTWERAIEQPSWRSYRVLGVPSDSEQADIFRAGAFRVLQYVLPLWAISQLYVLGAFIIAGISMGKCAEALLPDQSAPWKKQLVLLSAGILYIGNLLTSWIFFSPLKVFMAGYAFLPLVLWRLVVFYKKPHAWHALLLLVGMLFLTTSSMVPTTFIVEAGVLCWFLGTCVVLYAKRHSFRIHGIAIGVSLVIIFGTQLFWIVPFRMYVATNARALQTSYINRVLTPGLIQEEATYNTPENISRFFFAWMDTKNNDGTYQFSYRSWYRTPFGTILSYIPTALCIVGIMSLIVFRKKAYWTIPCLGIIGWVLIKGTNEPFGWIYRWLQEMIPLFQQVFRWQSSKLFPLLTIPIAYMGSLGIVFLIERIQTFHLFHKQPKTRRVIAFLFPITVLSTVLLYVYPYFIGGLVGNESYVHVPDAYFSLASYLESHDTNSRIYIAPEANTLYFRNYAWGFFGSSFLNYLLPNPIIEKALATGSMESEYAQKGIENAYAAKNPTAFVQALRLYNTPFVLLDRSSSRLHNGYDYDWDTTVVVIEHNASLEKVWEQGTLAVYKVKDGMSEKETSDLYLHPSHNWKNMLPFVTNVFSNGTSFISDGEKGGMIYPWMLEFTETISTEKHIKNTMVYPGPDETYVYTYDKEQTMKAPAAVFYTPTSQNITITPSFPTLLVNQTAYPFASVSKVGKKKTSGDLISINGDVFSVHTFLEKDTAVAASYADIGIAEWDSVPTETIQYSGVLKKTYSVSLTKPSILDITFSLTAPEDSYMNMCIMPRTLLTCVNRDQAFYLSKGQNVFHKTTPVVLDGPDIVDIYFTPSKDGDITSFALDTMTIHTYTKQNPIVFKEMKEEKPILSHTVGLRVGDSLRFVIPKILGSSSFHFLQENAFIPTVNHGTCDRTTPSYFFRPSNTGPIQFSTKACSDQLSLIFPRLYKDASSVAMVYVEGANESGIPLSVSMRDAKSQYHFFEDRLPYEQNGTILSFFHLPSELRSYAIDFYTYATGTIPSQNTIQTFSFQFIPSVWQTMNLTPSMAQYGEKGSIIGINQAVHPLWYMPHAKALRINGWEQGFMAQKTDERIVFRSDVYVYIGYVVLLGIGVSVILWLLLPLVKKVRSARHSEQTRT